MRAFNVKLNEQRVEMEQECKVKLEKLRSKLRLPICDLLIKRGSSKATVEDALVQMDSIPLDETEQPTSPFGCKCWKELSHRPGEL